MGEQRLFWILVITMTLQSKLSLQDNEKAGTSAAPPVEIVFSFDTTTSMYPVIGELRKNFAAMMKRLQGDIPNLRIAIFAHGDYIDRRWHYIIKHVDFTKNFRKLQKFVNTIKKTEGGDEAEAYELVLRQARERLTWTPNSKRALVVIGDEKPHEKDYPKNKLRIDWREEADYLFDMGVRIFAVRALNYDSESFYKTIAEKTEGYYLRLGKFSNIFDLIMAVTYRLHGLSHLKAYEKEVKDGHGTQGLPSDVQDFFDTLKVKPAHHKQAGRSGSAGKQTSHSPKNRKSPDIDVYHYHVRSTIAYRVAHTQILCKLANRKRSSSDVNLNIEIPTGALISGFTVEVDGKLYPSHIVRKTDDVKGKQHKAAKLHVRERPNIHRLNNNRTGKQAQAFRLKVSLNAKSRATFNLTYVELLKRKRGVYEHVTFFNFKQIVRDLKVDTFLQEAREITHLQVPPLRQGFITSAVGKEVNQLAFIDRRSSNSARIIYNPQAQDQLEISAAGLSGRLILQYDVKRDLDAGEIQVADGYFVHYFAPINLESVNKNVIFVVDNSEAMSAKKLRAVRHALKVILDNLRPGDFFNIIGFSNFSKAWNKEYLVASSDTAITSAKQFLDNMISTGGANLQQAMLSALELLNGHKEREDSADISIICLITNGGPTAGVTRAETIISSVKYANRNQHPIYSLLLGEEEHYLFLQTLSMQNKGLARRIYNDANISGQISAFFREIDTPTLTNIRVTYNNGMVQTGTVTTPTFTSYNNGSELLVAGVLKDPTMSDFNGKVKAKSARGPMQFDLSISMRDITPKRPYEPAIQRFAEMLWILLRIQDLNTARKVTSDENEKIQLGNKLWNISKQYNLVTSVTKLHIIAQDRPYQDGKNNDKSSKPVGIAGKEKEKNHHRGKHHGRGTGFADNDPHFLLKMDGSHLPICFDVVGSSGNVYQLIHDPHLGLTVNALFVGKNVTSSFHKTKTFLGKISLNCQQHHLVVSPDIILIDGGEFFWQQTVKLTLKSMHIQITRLKNVTVTLMGMKVKIAIIRHKVKPNHPTKTDFLGFYIMEGSGFSISSHGLIGQFEKRSIKITQLSQQMADRRHQAVLTFKNMFWKEPIPLHHKKRRNMVTRKHVRCWYVAHNGRGLLDGGVREYVVPHLKYDQFAPALKKHVRHRQDWHKTRL